MNGRRRGRPGQGRLTTRQRGALLLGRAAAGASRRLGRGGGTALPGLLAAAAAPRLIETLGEQLDEGAVTITGTNGKTTTAHLLAAAARAAGLQPLANRTGSNLERGLVSAYVESLGVGGRVDGAERRIGIFEVDEAALPALLPRIRPRAAIFLNLFRDQLDRYGEVDSVAEGWHAALEGDGSGLTLVLNADDPSVAQLASVARGEVVTFGVDDPRVALTDVEHASDARFCVCDTAFSYDAVYLGHVGAWRCDGCGRSRGEPDVVARDIVLAADGASFSLHAGAAAVPVALPLAGLYSVYNALATVAAAIALGLGVDAAVQALRDAAPAFGRQERFDVDGCDVRLLLAKNPAGLNAVVRSLAAAGDPLTLLMLLNDGVQDGRDVSWIYDADLERLAGRTRAVVVSGTRARDLALRLHLAGIDPDVVESDVERAVDAALGLTPDASRLDVVATYTAMIEVREALARRAGAPRYWEVAT